jgi:hypothetical protein
MQVITARISDLLNLVISNYMFIFEILYICDHREKLKMPKELL